ncbi:MAG TPA: AAA domain-containing protein [Luteimonas sp.]|nr:AAA domain-containing protein [Luteimonas sp.]
MSRPYLTSSIENLEKLFVSSRQHQSTLQLLAEELKFRKTPRARALGAKVGLALAAVASRQLARTQTVAVATPQTSQVKPTEVVPHPRASGASSSVRLEPPPSPISPAYILARDKPPEEILQSEYGNRPVDLLDAWTALEVLSPQTYRREADLAGGVSSNIISIANGRVPWDGGSARAKPNFKVYFHIVLGTMAAGPVYEALVERFKDTRLERPSVAGNIVLASLLVDKNGVLAGDAPVSLSAFGWGFPLALGGSLKELAAWTRHEQQLVEGLTKQLPRDTRNNEPTPLSMADLQNAFEWLIATLHLPREHVAGPSFAVRTYIYFTSKIVPDPLLLNSFFLRDLAKARDLAQTGKLPATLAAYLGELKPSVRNDLLHNSAALEESLAPAMAPLGRWPTAPDHTPALLQQSAVNLASRLHGHRGILGVNGPPGTGKSTLLRDIVADVVTRRATAMCAFADPARAFKVGWTKRARGETQELYSLDPSLRGFEMIVASSNNKAVENVSAEMPAIVALPTGSDLRYFAPLADDLVEREAWGMIAAVLGNATNRSRFRKAFWTESPRSFQRYLDRAAGLPQTDDSPGLAELCDAPSGPEEARTRWKVVQEHFNTLTAFAKDRLVQLETLRQAVLDLPRLHSEEEETQKRYGLGTKSAQDDQNQLQVRARTAQQARVASTQEQTNLDNHDACAPSFLKRVFRTQDARAWRGSRQLLQNQLNVSRQSEKSAAAAQADAERTVEASTRLARTLEQDLVRAQKALNTAKLRCAEIQIGAGACLLDDAFHALPHSQKQLSLPWLDAELQQLRSNVFAAAMGVHKAFIDAAALPLRRNLKALMDSNFGGIPPDRIHLAGDLWSSLFLAIPVVSTTFASVERMLGRLPPEALGWLLIDEAGQASPQAAVGGLMRCQRSVVVGDPQQIEPVVPLPDVLTTAVMREFNADADRFAAPAASVQTMADEASDHCATFLTAGGSRSVGAPLLVHRRCASPMFDVSNKIAYGNLMVQAKQPAKSAIREVLGPSRWIDVRGTARDKYCVEEGEQLLALLHTLRRAGVAPDLYVVTPFVVVQDTLRQLVSADGVLDGWIQNAFAWPKERIGTVHTVQGREAETVILVLGAPLPSQNGARQWAGRLPNLLNVAVTRAKEAVYVVGNRELWSGAGHFGVLHEQLR